MNHYPEFFRAGIQRTLQQSLAQVQAGPGHLSAPTRDQALHILSFALKLDDAWPLTRTLLLDLAPKMEQMGHRDDWLPYLEVGVEKCQQYNDLAAKAELSLQIGYLYQLRSHFEPARQWFARSIEFFTATADNSGRARALNHLAFVAWQERRLSEAEEYAVAALSLVNETVPEQASSFNTLGLVAFERAEWSKAEIYHRQALQIRRIQGNQRRVGWISQNLGNVLRNQGRYLEAIACYEEATRLLLPLQDVANQAIIQMNHGVTHYLAEEPIKAVALLEAAEITFCRLHDLHNLAKVRTNLGLTYLALQDWQAAEKAFASSGSLFQALKDVTAYLNALDGLGLVYIEQGRWHEALTVLQKAFIELSNHQDMPPNPALAKELQQHLARAKQGLANTLVNETADLSQ